MKLVSLFTGAGGIDYGFEAAKFETRACLDFDPDACAWLRGSRRWPVLESDIASVDPAQLLTAAGLAPGEADVLVGGPPCQPFSKSGFWAHGRAMRLDDPRAGTLGRYLEFVKVIRPRVVFFENVDAFAYPKFDEGLQFLLSGLDAINARCGTAYRPHFSLLNAANYGVPQHRNRFFLIAHREGRAFAFPPPTHGEAQATNTGAHKHAYATAWDAIGDLAQDASADPELAVTGKWAHLLPSIPEGQNYLWHTARGGGKPLFGWRTRYWSFLLKLAKNQPSWTLQAQPGPATGPLHWSNRYLSGRELCRLQTFPDDVSLVGGRRVIQKLLGNAVPSLLAEVLAREVAMQLLDAKPYRTAPRLMPQVRRPVPKAERTRPVPLKYLNLIADHAEHPGTGKGPRARYRDAAE